MVDISDVVRFDNLEDRLTAQFITTLENSAADIVLRHFLEAINFDLDFKRDLNGVQFGLQIRGGSRIPDAKIEGRNFLIYIEVKLGDSVDSSQIIGHFEGGKGKKQKFCVLSITSGVYAPQGVKDADSKLRERGEAPNIRWISWKKVYESMKRSEKEVKDEKERFLIKSFNSTLEKQGLVGFTGFEEDEFAAAIEPIERYTNLLRKCNQLMYEVAEELKKSSVKQVGYHRDGLSQKKLDLPTYASYFFNKDDWEPASFKWEKGSAAIIAFSFVNAGLFMGVTVTRQTLDKGNINWASFRKSFPFGNIRYRISDGGVFWAESIDSFFDEMEGTKSGETLEWADFLDVLSLEEIGFQMPDVETIVKSIRVSLEFLQKNALYQIRVEK